MAQELYSGDADLSLTCKSFSIKRRVGCLSNSTLLTLQSLTSTTISPWQPSHQRTKRGDSSAQCAASGLSISALDVACGTVRSGVVRPTKKPGVSSSLIELKTRVSMQLKQPSLTLNTRHIWTLLVFILSWITVQKCHFPQIIPLKSNQGPISNFNHTFN